jgi:hypothetical protein
MRNRYQVSQPLMSLCIERLRASGPRYCETDETEADEATVVENILSGQYSCPPRASVKRRLHKFAEPLPTLPAGMLTPRMSVPRKTRIAEFISRGAAELMHHTRRWFCIE